MDDPQEEAVERIIQTFEFDVKRILLTHPIQPAASTCDKVGCNKVGWPFLFVPFAAKVRITQLSPSEDLPPFELSPLQSAAFIGTSPQPLLHFAQEARPMLRPTLVCLLPFLIQTTDPAAIFRQGRQALHNGQFARAEEDFRQVIAIDPKSGAAHINLGVAYMRDRKWDEALTELQTAQKLLPREPGVLLNLGLAYYRMGNFPLAIAPFTQSLQLDPGSVQSRYLLGLCYFFVSQYDKAAETLSPLWNQQSSNLNYLYVLSIAASKSSNTSLQKQAFDRLIAVGQGTPEFHLYLGKAYLAQDETAKALEEFHTAAVAEPSLPLIHYFLGRSYLVQRDFPNAEAELRQQLATDPDFAYSYEDLGLLYQQQNQPFRAEPFFYQAVERNNTLVNSWYGLAGIYRDSADFAKALDMLDHAVKLAPESASIHFARGQVLQRLGQAAKAKEELTLTAHLQKSARDRLLQDPLDSKQADAETAAPQ